MGLMGLGFRVDRVYTCSSYVEASSLRRNGSIPRLSPISSAASSALRHTTSKNLAQRV